ncbi:MAG: PqqD family protein [Thermodesulfobacteriota bacterium]
MSSKNHFRINAPKITHETIDGETVIINLDNGTYYSLVGAGAEIWGLIESGAAVDDIIEAINHRYEGAPADIECGVSNLVAEFQQEGLVVPGNGKEPENFELIKTQVGTESQGKRPVFKAPILDKYTDMQDLLLLDPIHEVDETGWPTPKPSEE